MKDNKQLKKVIYINKSDIALVVFNQIDSKNNILFASQVKLDNADLKVKVNELLTNAANWLGFNIKDAQIVFADPEITKYSETDAQFIDCSSQEDIAKEIYKQAKLSNKFVNQINFIGVRYDDIDKTAYAHYEVIASNYVTYKKYLNAVKACNVVVTNSVNIYNLLNSNNCPIELVINIINKDVYACQYYGNKLTNVTKLDVDYNHINRSLANYFDVNQNSIDQIIELANNTFDLDEDINLAVNYELRNKKFNNVSSNKFKQIYQDELRNQINKFVDFRNFQMIRIVSDAKINQLSGCEFVTSNDLGLEELSIDKVVCLANLDVNQTEMTHFTFENKINKPIMAA